MTTFNNQIRLAEFPPLATAEPEIAPDKMVKKTEVKEKKSKKSEDSADLKVTDRVKIYTGVVPDLEDGKDKLKEILKQDYDASVRQSLEGFIEQLEQMQIAMLDFAKVAIQSSKIESLIPSVETTDAPAEVEVDGANVPAPVKITASMINN